MATKAVTLIETYNTTGNIIVISDYPRKGKTHDANVSALGFFSKNTIVSLEARFQKKQENKKIIVFANLIDKETLYEEENTRLIIRVFRKNNLTSFIRLARYILAFTNVHDVLFEFEFGSYANWRVAFIIPFLLLVQKLSKKRVFFVLHQVETDLKKLHGQLGFKHNTLFLMVIEYFLQIFYRILGKLVYKVVVLEQELSDRLLPLVDKEKIAVIPLGIEKHAQKKQTKQADTFMILLFGYIAWYKGTDRIITIVNKLPERIMGKKIKLIVAGGKSFSQKGNKHYENYFSSVQNLIKQSSKTTFVDFVPEQQIPDYFLKADLCIFPYRVFLSSSGPLSFALSFRKAVALSKELTPYLRSKDFKKALAQANLTPDDLFLELSKPSLIKRIKKVIKDPTYTARMNTFTKALAKKRAWEKVGKQYEALLSEPLPSTQTSSSLTSNTELQSAYQYSFAERG